MAKELIYKVRIEMDSSSATRSTQNLEKTQENAEQAVDKTTQAIKRQEEASESASRGQRNFQKATSNANQTLFTFGDLINDAQQFQFGFAQGSRAIGNNIAFAAEQISNTSARAGGFTNTLKALGSSLLGPGGIILAVNLAVTALTVFGDKLFGSKEKAKDLKEEVDELREVLNSATSALSNFFGEGAEGRIEELEAQRQVLQENIQQLQPAIDKRKELREVEQQIEKLRSDNLEVNQKTGNLQVVLNKSEKEKLQSLKDQRGQLQVFVDQNEGLFDTIENQKKSIKEITQEIEKQNRIIAARERIASNISSQFVGIQLFDENTRRILDILQAGQLRIGDIDVASAVEGAGFGREQQIQRQKDLAQAIGKTREEVFQDIASKEVQIFRQAEDQKTQIARIAEAQRREIFVNAVSAAGDLIGQAFGQSKELAIAQTLVSTYAAAQKAYESQLAIPTPDAPARAAAAAAVAVAQGLARLAAIRSTQIGSGGGSEGGSSRNTRQEGANIGSLGEFGNRTRVIEPNRNQNPVVINVTNRIDREGMALAVKDGNAVLNQRTTQISSD